MPEIIFWIGVITLIYTYLGYPIFLITLNKLLHPKYFPDEATSCFPSVSILIAAYNEEKVIRCKIENCLRLDYPAELLDIWIASDGSLDNTNRIVQEYASKDNRIHLIEFPRTGKSDVINKTMPHIQSEIVVFSDANTEYVTDAIRNLVKYFSSADIGCVCGRLIYRNPDGVISGKGEGFYWRYETFLKKLESKIGYVAGANGAIYAIRRGLFENLPAKTINDDFTISMQIVKKGLKSIYAEDAIAYEDVATTLENEFKRHVRDGTGHYIAVFHLMGLLNPLLGIRSVIYWSHRILRWFAPFILILLFIINIILLYYSNAFYKALFIPHFLFYLFAVIGLTVIKNKRLPFFMYIPFYFCNLNLALLLGFFKVIIGKQKTTWERTERIG